MLPAHLLDAVHRGLADAEHSHLARTQIKLGAITRCIDCFGEHPLPAQAVVEGEFRSHAPGVLAIPKHALLPLLRVGAGADVPGKSSHVAEQERRESEALLDRATLHDLPRVAVCEGQFPGAMIVARHPQLQRIPDVRAELVTVVADDLRCVVHELILLLALREGAVALIDA